MNISENARALRRGLLVILLIRLRQTPRNGNTLKVPRFFVCVPHPLNWNNGATEKPYK